MRLMNVFGDAAEHVILSAVPDALGARDAIDPAIRVFFPGDAAPALFGKPSPARYDRLSRYMQGFDLVLTYNWGSMDAVGARRMFAPFRQLPRLIHHEDGFNVSESQQLNAKRNWFRRLMLPTAERLVVPSQQLEGIARFVWKQPVARVLRIPNGIEVGRYSDVPEPGSIPGLNRAQGDIVVGTIAGLRGIKNLPRLVRAVAAQPPHVKLVIVGEGPERTTIIAEAKRLGIADRVSLPGFLASPHRYVGHFAGTMAFARLCGSAASNGSRPMPRMDCWRSSQDLTPWYMTDGAVTRWPVSSVSISAVAAPMPEANNLVSNPSSSSHNRLSA